MLAIQLNNIGKRYRLEYKNRDKLSLKESFLDLFRGDIRQREFWALKEINLDIPQGQALGIIGRNGSGKTTLLKLLCGVTKPTTGSRKINGKIVGLLELGAGFHGDLTGRENIYLNGSIFGLSRKEIQRNIDAIINFADIGDFIDAPVRTFSSGMYLRLGFAIATHIDCDILLIDEVLAVGDLVFQKKCLKKINEHKENNKTLILVSQDMNIVRQLCSNVIWLDEGRIVKEGKAIKVVEEYEMSVHREIKKERIGLNLKVEITNVYFLDEQEEARNEFVMGEKMIIRIEYFAHDRIDNPVFGLGIFRDDGIHITGPNTKFSDFRIDFIKGRGSIDFITDALPLLPGNYDISVAIHTYEDEANQYDFFHRLFKFKVVNGAKKEKYGIVFMPHRWKIRNQGY